MMSKLSKQIVWRWGCWFGAGIVLLFLAVSGTSFAWLLGIGWLLHSVWTGIGMTMGMRQLKVERRPCSSRYFSGDCAEVTVNIEMFSTRWLPWFMVVTDEEFEEPHVLFPWGRRKLSYMYKMTELPRGNWQETHVTIVAGDLFGWLRVMKSVESALQVMVVPKPMVVRNVYSQAFEQEGYAQRSRSGARLNAELRDYREGDSMRHIHWRASARGDGWKTRETEHPQNHGLLVMLWSSQAYDEEAVSLTAGLYEAARRLQESFTLETPFYAGIQLKQVNEQTYWSGMEQLAELKLRDFAGGPADYRWLGRRVSRMSAGSRVICVSDLVNGELPHQYWQLRRHRLAITLYWLREHEQWSPREQHIRHQLQQMGTSVIPWICHPEMPHDVDPSGRRRALQQEVISHA